MERIECQRSYEAMGTRFDVILRGNEFEHLDAVAVAVLEEVQRLDGVLSRFDPRSEIARLNREAWRRPLKVDREVFALLERCEQAKQTTQGYFDVTLGASLTLDAERCTVQFPEPDVVIDLGGIGKGYALDCGREIVRRFQVESALLQGGTSSVLAIGEDIWPVDVRRPLRPDQVVARLELVNRGLSCSAIRHAHQVESDVLNPLTQTPLSGNAACVVVAATATEAEIFSTALLSMGEPGAMKYLRAHPDLNLKIHWLNE